jgi:hypothetical protein
MKRAFAPRPRAMAEPRGESCLVPKALHGREVPPTRTPVQKHYVGQEVEACIIHGRGGLFVTAARAASDRGRPGIKRGHTRDDMGPANTHCHY